jgi:curved DNA-binding protein CbpA
MASEKRAVEDPWRVLGIAVEAGAAEIRSAYLRAVKLHPPERDPEEFERVRDAYALLADPRERISRLILDADPEAPVVSLLDQTRQERRFVGPEAWLSALRG